MRTLKHGNDGSKVTELVAACGRGAHTAPSSHTLCRMNTNATRDQRRQTHRAFPHGRRRVHEATRHGSRPLCCPFRTLLAPTSFCAVPLGEDRITDKAGSGFLGYVLWEERFVSASVATPQPTSCQRLLQGLAWHRRCSYGGGGGGGISIN